MSIQTAPVEYLLQEYQQNKSLFEMQPKIGQHFLEQQAQIIADGLVNDLNQCQFSLPAQVYLPVNGNGTASARAIPETLREQKVGRIGSALLGKPGHDVILNHLRELEQTGNESISSAAALLRYAAARHIIFNLLPAGRQVVYRAEEGEQIPSIPASDGGPDSAITEVGDAIVEDRPTEKGRGELQSPFVKSARSFFLPQWVAFDDQDNLLVWSENEAEAHILSMQKYLEMLHRASALAPYFVACDEYQRKRYGILGQLINQGRALANFMTHEIIHEIKQRAKNNSLNRGLSLSLPYFNDQSLELVNLNFEVIPAGRIMFVPAFVVRAAREEQAKVAQDTRLNASTRQHLMGKLKALESAFSK